MSYPPLKERRHQRYLRTVVWGWCSRHGILSRVLILVFAFAASTLLSMAISSRSVPFIVLGSVEMAALLIAFAGYAYAAICEIRVRRYADRKEAYEERQFQESLERPSSHVRYRGSFADFVERSNAISHDGHVIIEGEVVA